MTDFKVLKDMLGSLEEHQPLDDWRLDPTISENDGGEHTLVYGCPNGAGAYLQCVFDERGALLRAEIINTNGDPCSCRWCIPSRKNKRGKRRSG